FPSRARASRSAFSTASSLTLLKKRQAASMASLSSRALATIRNSRWLGVAGAPPSSRTPPAGRQPSGRATQARTPPAAPRRQSRAVLTLAMGRSSGRENEEPTAGRPWAPESGREQGPGEGSLLREVLLDVLQDLVGVLGRLGGGVDLADDALLVDHERAARGEPVRPQDPVLLGRLLVGVREEREGEHFLVGELLLVGAGVGAAADDHGIELSKLLNAVAKTAGLDRSAPGHGFGEEVQDDVLAAQILQVERLGVFLVREHLADRRRGQVDVGRRLSHRGHLLVGLV